MHIKVYAFTLLGVIFIAQQGQEGYARLPRATTSALVNGSRAALAHFVEPQVHALLPHGNIQLSIRLSSVLTAIHYYVHLRCTTGLNQRQVTARNA